ncbi:MAG: Acetophenone carboxylase gamma subunit [Syntrophorhabdus sp. PtaU1.Bin058]|nr:MAG: Acetophenone carboxylase gamma subunit [Syntrophorhabdus sp. PtaU1.Bin058]
MGYTIDIDTGGTFTDGFFVKGARVETVKVPTTHHDLTVCFLECIKAGAGQFGVSLEDILTETEVIRFSSTIGTNTLIERNGTKIGLMLSRGEDKGLQVVNEEEESPLVYPEMVRILGGQIGKNGEEVEGLKRDEVLRAGQELLDLGARCLVVSLKNSVFNPVHERQVRTWLKGEYPRDYLGSVPVFLSSDTTNLPGDQERINTAVVNAYIHARLVKFLYKAGEDLRKRFFTRPLLIVHATGGVARVANTKAINTYNSGPAAGLMGVMSLGKLYGTKHLVSGDMGGTSFDIGVVRNGQPNFTLRPNVEGLDLSVPMVAIRPIGAGGGSIATVRKGELQVGPQSAGALPGPACFNLGGTQATVTDADVALGYIDPGYYLGGKMQLDGSRAIEVIEAKVASQLRCEMLEAALAIRDKVDANMGTALKEVIEATGSSFKPALVIYGGAGSAHCCGLAKYAGIKKIIAPLYASVFSACSLSSMDIWHIYSRRLGMWLKKDGRMAIDHDRTESLVRSMYAEAARDMRGEGFREDQVLNHVEFFLSRGGDVPEGRVIVNGKDWSGTLDNALKKQTPKIYEAPDIYGPLVFMHATAQIPHYETSRFDLAGREPSKAFIGTRPVCWEKGTGMVETPIYNRSNLLPGNVVEGPAIVEALDTTYVIRKGWTYRVDEYLNGIFEEV